MTPQSGWAQRLHASSAAALYVHIPFCARKCSYCDFASAACAPNDSLMGAYVDTIVDHLGRLEAIGLLDGVKTAYIGGGTPSFLPGRSLGQLVGCVASLGVDELSCEANPDSLSAEKIELLKAAGATRLSIGVQSLDDKELAALGRLHDSRQAKEAVSHAVASGLDVSCDLMCATPHQTDASWAKTLRELTALNVGHVSVYPLMIEEGTPFDRLYGDEDCDWNSDSVQADRMTNAQGVLEGLGYARYEVASYALPGKQCRHNKAYWTGLSYLGLGHGASSMLTLESYLKLRSVCYQLPELPKPASRVRLSCTTPTTSFAEGVSLADLSFSLETLDAQQAAAEDLMLGARMVEGIGPGLYAYACDVLGAARVGERFDHLQSRGLLAEKNGSFQPTQQGWLLGNELYGELWALAEDDGPVFSCEV